MFWHLTRPEIEGWFDLKLREFAEAENQSLKLSKSHWLDIYIYDCPHEWFFCEFLVILCEWFTKFNSKKIKFQGGELTSWTPEKQTIRHHGMLRCGWTILWRDTLPSLQLIPINHLVN